MSKAFLKESDLEDTAPLQRASVLPPNARNYITAAGAEYLKEELQRLIEIERPALRARKDDPEARSELRQLDDRVRHLQESLRTAEVSRSTESTERVRFGSRVLVKDRTGSEEQYIIVGVDETEFFPNAISWRSPLAQALLNQPLRATVTVLTPAGSRELELLEIH